MDGKKYCLRVWYLTLGDGRVFLYIETKIYTKWRKNSRNKQIRKIENQKRSRWGIAFAAIPHTNSYAPIFFCHYAPRRNFRESVSFINKNCFRYDDCLGYIHGVKFDPNSSEWNVHVSHQRPFTITNLTTKNTVEELAKMKGVEKKDEQITIFQLSEQPFYKIVLDNLISHSKKTSCLFSDVTKKSKSHKDPSKACKDSDYHIWGCDFLVLEDFRTVFLEMNVTFFSNTKILNFKMMQNFDKNNKIVIVFLFFKNLKNSKGTS